MENKTQTVYIIILIAFALIFLGYSIGFEVANPCVEYGTDCEIECYGEGDCVKECPCIKRKYN